MTDTPETHARSTDPDTSHMAVPANITEQALQVLQAYRGGAEILDHQAYRYAGLGVNRLANQRCSDLRRAGLIERTTKALTPSGNWGWRCRITPAGLDYLATHRLKDQP
jgi:hypothetical protein